MTMKPRVVSAREHVIRRNINTLRESIIERQLEAEFLELCINEVKPKMLKLYDEIVAMGGFPTDENESMTKEKAEAINLYKSAKASVETMVNTLNEHKAVEAALSKKMDFYKNKRQALIDKRKEYKKQQETKFVKEGLDLLNSAPEKINVDTNGINFKKAGK